jgi:hypothetical protein
LCCRGHDGCWYPVLSEYGCSLDTYYPWMYQCFVGACAICVLYLWPCHSAVESVCCCGGEQGLGWMRC